MTAVRTAGRTVWIAALWLAAALHQAAAASLAPVPTSPGDRHLPRGVFSGETEVLEVRVPVWILGPKGLTVRDVPCSDVELLEDGGPVQVTSCEPPRPSEAPAPDAWASPSGSCELTVFVDMYLATPGEAAGAVRDIAVRLASLQGRKVNLVVFDGALHRYDLRAGAVENDEILADVRKLKAQGAVIVPEEDSGGVLRGRGTVREHRERCDTVRRAVERSAGAFAGVAAEAAARCPGTEIWLYSPLVPRSGGPGGSERFMRPRSSCSDEVLVSIWRRVGELISGAGGWLRVVDPRGVLPEAGSHGSSIRRQAGETLVRATGGEYVRTGASGRFSRSDAYLLKAL